MTDLTSEPDLLSSTAQDQVVNILDSVIDYLNYVIIPSLMIYWFGMVPSILEIILPAAIFLVSLFTFANLQMKTDDYYFRGFPAVWNIVVLYLGMDRHI